VAMITPTSTIVMGSVLPSPMAAVEAMSRFDGPANGIRLNPNEVPKIIRSSISVAMLRCHVRFRFRCACRSYKCKLNSAVRLGCFLELAVV
jgi:hypothetical protein